ncbi:cysteine hydrolase family protein [Paenibacillus sp. 2TAB19]|uniref:cysteine hydrolase family protein n=1 Tax=Paenibacillus sp. 2TAB19 TaxID=3233003 RepID=UPI003F959C33
MLSTNKPYTFASVMELPTALFIIDMQNDFVHEDGAFAKGGYSVEDYHLAVPVIDHLRGVANHAGIPVWMIGMSHNEANDGDDAWVQRRRASNHPDTCRTGTWGSEFYEPLTPGEEHTVFWKHRYSAFVGTDLHERLQQQSIQTLIFTGINTNTCVESTVRDAHLLGYHVIVIRDATACAYKDAYEPSLNNIERHFGFVTTSDKFIKLLEEN